MKKIYLVSIGNEQIALVSADGFENAVDRVENETNVAVNYYTFDLQAEEMGDLVSTDNDYLYILADDVVEVEEEQKQQETE